VDPRGGAGQCRGQQGSPERQHSGEAGRGSVVAVAPVMSYNKERP
jgi:hypothetical protein